MQSCETKLIHNHTPGHVENALGHDKSHIEKEATRGKEGRNNKHNTHEHKVLHVHACNQSNAIQLLQLQLAEIHSKRMHRAGWMGCAGAQREKTQPTLQTNKASEGCCEGRDVAWKNKRYRVVHMYTPRIRDRLNQRNAQTCPVTAVQTYIHVRIKTCENIRG